MNIYFSTISAKYSIFYADLKLKISFNTSKYKNVYQKLNFIIESEEQLTLSRKFQVETIIKKREQSFYKFSAKIQRSDHYVIYNSK